MYRNDAFQSCFRQHFSIISSFAYYQKLGTCVCITFPASSTIILLGVYFAFSGLTVVCVCVCVCDNAKTDEQ